MSRIGVLLIALATAAMGAPQRDTRAEAQLQAAINKETVEGDLKSAIEQYRKVAQSGNRAVAAKALIRMGQCYEKLGDAESRKAYERVVREFADQKDAVAEARKRLGTGGGAERGVVARQVWTGQHYGAENRVHQAVSKDGRHLAYTVGRMGPSALSLSDTRTGETRVVVPSGSMIYDSILFSPDGQQIAYIARDRNGSSRETRIAGIDGTTRRVFTREHLKGVRAGGWWYDWSPDGKYLLGYGMLAGQQDEEFLLCSVADASCRGITKAAKRTRLGTAKFSPDGRYIAAARRVEDRLDRDLSLISVQDGREIPLPVQGVSPEWTPDGKALLFGSDRRGTNDLWAIRVENGKAAGEPVLVRENLGSWYQPLGFSRDGEYFYQSLQDTRDLFTVDFDPRTGAAASSPKKITHRYINGGPAWSPDGELLAYYSQRGPTRMGFGAFSIVIRSVRSGEERVVTPRPPIDPNLSKPQWFPDGRSLFIYPQMARETGKLAQLDIHTGDVRFLLNAEVIRPNPYNLYRPGVILAPDGRSVAYISSDGEARVVRVLRRDLAGGAEQELCRLQGVTMSEPSFSPDGSRLAFWLRFDPKEKPALMTLPITGGEPARVRKGDYAASSYVTQWSRDGRRLFFTSGKSDICSVPVEGGEPVCLGIHQNMIWSFDLHPNGKSLVFYDEIMRQDVWALKNVTASIAAARR